VSIPPKLRTNFNDYSIRTAPGSSLAIGDALIMQQVINVQLLYVMYPVAVWFIVSTFVAATIARTVRKDIPSWKSSPLPLLRCMDSDNKLDTAKHIEEYSNNTKVQLIKTTSNWQLKEWDEK
jgi:hypothetical protein